MQVRQTNTNLSLAFRGNVDDSTALTLSGGRTAKLNFNNSYDDSLKVSKKGETYYKDG